MQTGLAALRFSSNLSRRGATRSSAHCRAHAREVTDLLLILTESDNLRLGLLRSKGPRYAHHQGAQVARACNTAKAPGLPNEVRLEHVSPHEFTPAGLPPERLAVADRPCASIAAPRAGGWGIRTVSIPYPPDRLLG